MKRISKWLESKFSRHSAGVEADERHTPVGVRVSVRVKPKDIAKQVKSFLGGRVQISLQCVDNERSVFYETNI